MSEVGEPVESRPWRPEDGPRPRVWVWPYRDRPALWVWSRGRWRWAEVTARQDHPGGEVRYVVDVDPDGSTQVTSRTYAWPQPGLRVARRSTTEPADRMPVVPPAPPGG